MRILHFCNYADRIGGAEVYAHALVGALRARGHEVALFGGSPGEEVDRPGLRVIRRPAHDAARLVQDRPSLEALEEYLGRFRPDVVHVHNLFSVALEVVDHLGRCGLPLLHTVHDFQLLCPNSWCVRGDGTPCPGGAGAQCFEHGCQANYPYDSWGVLLAAQRQRLAARATDVAVAPSSYLVERLRAHGWRDVRHLPYFIDFTPAPLDSPRAEDELLYVGRLQREKGVHVLLEAMPAIRRAVPGVKLTLVGSGTELPRLRRQMEEARLASCVRFLEGIPRDRLSEFYARASACILPSVWTENSPLVAYECQLSGTPMLGSRIGGIPELIEPDCGLAFGAGNSQDLADVVIRFLRLPREARLRMSDASRQRAKAFDKERHLDSVEGIYSELGARPRRTPLEAEPMLPVLARLGEDLVRHTPRPNLLQRARGLARRLGLPKLLPPR